nr:hypothetical protein [Tanacetum cinerariifolium]
MALKAELRNLKLRDLSIDGYFQKIESIFLVLNGLGSPLSNDDVVTFTLEGLPSTYETIPTVIVRFKTLLLMLPLLLPSNTSARRGPSLEKVNNPCWSFAKGSCRFGDACKYLHNGIHGKSTFLPRTSGSTLSVPDVTRSDWDMLQSLLAKFRGSNMGMAGLFPQGVQYPMGSLQQEVYYPQQGVQTLFGPPQGVHLVPGPSQPLVQFTTGVQQQQGFLSLVRFTWDSHLVCLFIRVSYLPLIHKVLLRCDSTGDLYPVGFSQTW